MIKQVVTLILDMSVYHNVDRMPEHTEHVLVNKVDSCTLRNSRQPPEQQNPIKEAVSSSIN